jgi:hypothetical protein
VASAEPDARRRGDYGGLALVFSQATRCQPAWKQALKGWNMLQSTQVLEWMAEGKAEGRAEDILRLLELRFQQVPADLVTRLRETTEVDLLRSWFDLAFGVASLDDFRQATKP